MSEKEKLKPSNFSEKFQRYTLMDNSFMIKFFEKKKEALYLVARILLGMPDLEFIEIDQQHTIKSLNSHSACFDIYAKDKDGNEIDIEIQNGSRDGGPHRARFYSSMLVVNSTPANMKKIQLKKTFVLFVRNDDIMKKGEAIYPVKAYWQSEDGEQLLFDDNTNIWFVNATYRGNDDIGKLLHDLNCSRAEDMYIPELREHMHDMKTSKEVEDNMDEISQECFDEGYVVGEVKGKAQGLIEGKIEGKIETLADMVEAGFVTCDVLIKNGRATAEEVAQIEEILKQRKKEKTN